MVREQKPWAEWTIRERLGVIANARHRIAGNPDAFSAAISPVLARNPADSLAAEVLPLLAAMRFLEKQAERILRPRLLSRSGLPIWLTGTRSEVARSPFGTVLIIGPSNYPLMLAGIQSVQALVAGNTVIWKPGQGGSAVAKVFAETLYASGLPRELLRVTDESIEAVDAELAHRVDKVFFTGSAAVGRIISQKLAHTLTPSVMELSGCDAVIVLPSADLTYVAKAVAFGMRLNGSATCMAPRRLLLVNASPDRGQDLIRSLLHVFAEIRGVRLASPIREQLKALLLDAQRSGATVHGDAEATMFGPLIVAGGHSTMAIAQADLFAPVVTMIDVDGERGVLAAQTTCPFGLTASIFGNETEARQLATKMDVGTVLINDAIVSTADPRVPFGGRRQSGFGTSQGAEGLLEMTAPKTVLVRRGNGARRFDATGELHTALFQSLIRVLYADGWKRRLQATRELVRTGRKMPR